MLTKSLIAKKYSEALFDVALHGQELLPVLEDLRLVVEVLAANQQYKYFVMSKVVPRKTKFVFLNTAIEQLKLNKITVGLLYTLVSNNRMYVLQELTDAYEARIRVHNNQEAVQVEVAMELGKAEAKRLQDALAKALGKEILLTVLVKPELLGGMIVRYGSKMLDSSLLHKLQKIAKLALS